MPKSHTLTTSWARPSSSRPRRIMMFSGLRSRWRIPISCATASAASVCRTMSAMRCRLERRVGSGSRRGGSRPSRNSMTMYRSPSGSSPTSMTRVELGWSIIEAALASTLKRATNCWSASSERCSTFTATALFRAKCCALYTAPIPPVPTHDSTLYLPAMIRPMSGSPSPSGVGPRAGHDSNVSDTGARTKPHVPACAGFSASARKCA